MRGVRAPPSGCRSAGSGVAPPSQHADGGGRGSAEPHYPPPCSPRIRHERARPQGRPAATGGPPRHADQPAVRTGQRGGIRRTGGAGSTRVTRGGHRRQLNGSGRQALATLATTRGEDRTARAGAHPKTEAVLLVPTTVVRLERPLAHWNDSGYSRSHVSTNPLIDLSLVQVLPTARESTMVPQGAQHETAGSTPTDPRYVAACGQVKPVIPILFHRPVDRTRSQEPVTHWSEWLRTATEMARPHHDYAPASTRHAGGRPHFGSHSLWMTA